MLRCALGVLLAPLPAALIALLAYAPDAYQVPARTIPIVATPIVWFVLLGSAFLVLGRFRGKITRMGCLVLGALTAATWPYAVLLMKHWLPSKALAQIGMKPLPDFQAAVIGLVSSPTFYSSTGICIAAGLLTGWLLWRFGVRPAAEPIDFQVFD
jgi:hypothetical protein